MRLQGADYELVWPAPLFVAEAIVLDATDDGRWSARLETLLEEAFAGPAPRDDFKGVTHNILAGGRDQHQFVRRLIEAAPTLPLASDPRPYYPQRHGAAATALFDGAAVRRRFVRLIAEFESRGYFESVFPRQCVDDRDFRAVNESFVLEDHLGVAGLWPLNPAAWDDDLFYGLIEVFHDLVARPRDRWWHDWSGCGWHYSNFAIEPARQLYRWRVNRLLVRSEIPLRLANNGEDIGRLVTGSDEARTDLVDRLLNVDDHAIAGRVRHAIALFRARGATDEEKRSAIVVLAGVLEERRTVLQDRLFSKDEGALFEIANRFSLRHRNESQKADYDPAFLDWIFWWYAATVELTDRLLARPDM